MLKAFASWKFDALSAGKIKTKNLFLKYGLIREWLLVHSPHPVRLLSQPEACKWNTAVYSHTPMNVNLEPTRTESSIVTTWYSNFCFYRSNRTSNHPSIQYIEYYITVFAEINTPSTWFLEAIKNIINPIKIHRFCVLPPLANHCFWWALISG